MCVKQWNILLGFVNFLRFIFAENFMFYSTFGAHIFYRTRARCCCCLVFMENAIEAYWWRFQITLDKVCYPTCSGSRKARHWRKNFPFDPLRLALSAYHNSQAGGKLALLKLIITLRFTMFTAMLWPITMCLECMKLKWHKTESDT